jgi:hypothetical protein
MQINPGNMEPVFLLWRRIKGNFSRNKENKTPPARVAASGKPQLGKIFFP